MASDNPTKVVVARAPLCLGSRRWPAPAPSDLTSLSPTAQQGLADLIPVLLCGEESAEHVFRSAASEQASTSLDPTVQAGLCSIAGDEHRHGDLLLALRKRLPCTRDPSAVKRSARFLKSLSNTDLGTHLLRVSALDAGVCMVLAAVTAPGTAIAGAREICELFLKIRRDEGRHVRLSRNYASVLGADMTRERAERQEVMRGFCALLADSSQAFIQLDVDPRRLLLRLARFGDGVSTGRRHIG